MDYAYFSLAMSYDKEKAAGHGKKKEKDSLLAHVINKSDDKGYGALKGDATKDDDMKEFKEDIEKAEKLFPRKDGPAGGAEPSGDYDGWTKTKGGGDGPVDVSDKEGLLDRDDGQEKHGELTQHNFQNCVAICKFGCKSHWNLWKFELNWLSSKTTLDRDDGQKKHGESSVKWQDTGLELQRFWVWILPESYACELGKVLITHMQAARHTRPEGVGYNKKKFQRPLPPTPRAETGLTLLQSKRM